jgi:hypothetical protein
VRKRHPNYDRFANGAWRSPEGTSPAKIAPKETFMLASWLLLAPALGAPQQPDSLAILYPLADDTQRELIEELSECRQHGRAAEFQMALGRLAERNHLRRTSLAADLERAGAEVIDSLPLTGGLLIAGLDPLEAEELRRRADVLSVTFDEARGPSGMTAALLPAAPLPAPLTLASAIDGAHHNHLAVHQGGNEGQQIGIAILDSGIDADHAGSGRPHAAFFVDGDPTNSSALGLSGSRVIQAGGNFGGEDDFGHGTRMASFAAGAKYNGLPGVSDGGAPGADIYSYRITQPGGLTTIFLEAQGLEYAASIPEVRVANLSYDGSADPGTAPNPSLDMSAASGLVVTVSAGNAGASIDYHHGAFNALAVGSSFLAQPEPYLFPGFQQSALGPLLDGRRYPHLIAVGENLTGAKLDDEASFQASYGTSGASALTAGAAALVFRARPNSTGREVRALLLNALDAVQAGPDEGRGYGYLNASDAVFDALTDQVVEGVALPYVRNEHALALNAGESARATLAWDRLNTTVADGGDLDLYVFDPAGVPVVSSTATRQNIEQVQWVANQAGTYTVVVDFVSVPANQSPASQPLRYALAGVPSPSTYVADPCVGSTPQILQLDPPVVTPAQPTSGWFPSPTGLLRIKGCALENVGAVTIGGLQADFVALPGGEALEVTPPQGLSGTQPLEVHTSQGVLTTNVSYDAGGPLLFPLWPTIDIGFLSFQLSAEPGSFYAVFWSMQIGPTSVPGLFDLDLGAGTLAGGLAGAALYQYGFMPAKGEVIFTENNLDAFLPNGQIFHLQAIGTDGAITQLPAVSSNLLGLLVFGGI